MKLRRSTEFDRYIHTADSKITKQVYGKQRLFLHVVKLLFLFCFESSLKFILRYADRLCWFRETFKAQIQSEVEQKRDKYRNIAFHSVKKQIANTYFFCLIEGRSNAPKTHPLDISWFSPAKISIFTQFDSLFLSQCRKFYQLI